MNREDRRAVLAVARVGRQIATAVEAIVAALSRGGRPVCVGARAGPGGAGGLDTTQGWYRDQACPQHTDDGDHGAARKGVRQPHGGSPAALGQVEGACGAPDRRDRGRPAPPRASRARRVWGQGEGRDRDGALRVERAASGAGAPRGRRLAPRGASAPAAEVAGADPDWTEPEGEEEPAEGQDERCRGQPERAVLPEDLTFRGEVPPQRAYPVHTFGDYASVVPDGHDR